ncbi:MAG: NAD(P)-dependent oxidoreductase [Patescibacteria group bacterium]
MIKKALITGGAGFIGYHLAKHLAGLDYKVVITDNFFRSTKDKDLSELLTSPNVEFIQADLTNMTEWDKLGSGYDQVYHLAAVNGTKLFYEMPHEVLRINLMTTINAIEWFRSKNSEGKILFTSSNELYAGAREAFDSLPIPTPETVPAVIPDISNPRWSYASTKLIGEQLFIHYAKSYNLRMAIVRPHNFYGPRAGYHHVIPELIGRYLNKTDPFIVYGEQDKRSFCYIDDAVRAIRLVMESDKTDGQTYHIGSPEEYKMRGLAEAIFTTFGWRPKKVEYQESPAGSVKRRLADISKIKRDTGWEPIVPFTEGVKKTFDWYIANPKK